MDINIGEYFTYFLVPSAGIAPFTYSLCAGSLPTGLALTSSYGIIDGTPSVSGSYDFTICVSDATACSDSTDFNINVVAEGMMSVAGGNGNLDWVNVSDVIRDATHIAPFELSSLDEFTVEFWLDTFGGNTEGFFRLLGNAFLFMDVFCYGDSLPGFTCRVKNDDGIIDTMDIISPTINMTQFDGKHHFAFTRDATTLYAYIDSVLIDSIPRTNASLTTFSLINTPAIEWWGSGDANTVIKVKDIRISNTCHNSFPDVYGIEADTVGLWACQEGSGTTVGDTSVNGQNMIADAAGGAPTVYWRDWETDASLQTVP